MNLVCHRRVLEREGLVNDATDHSSARHVDDLTHVFFASHEYPEYSLVASEHRSHLQLGAIAGGHTADTVAATHCKRPGRSRPEFGAYVVENDVHAAPIGNLSHALGNVLGGVVDDVVGSKL